MQPKLSNLMEEALRQKKYAQVCLLFGRTIKKNKGCCEAFTLKVKGEEKNMCFPNDVALKKKKLNFFKIGGLWSFKCFF